MTKKNFVSAAKIVSHMEEPNRNTAYLAFVRFFRNDDSKFDVVRFAKACGYPATKAWNVFETFRDWEKQAEGTA